MLVAADLTSGSATQLAVFLSAVILPQGSRMKILTALNVSLILSAVAGCGRGGSEPTIADAAAGTVVFQGGYETDPVDRGRPVALIAGALGVETEVFRDAFSGVNPAHGRGPSEAEARANKKVLLDALGQHGITNDRLDEVSNYYRYQPQSGELWQHTPATATATVSDGKVVSVKITNPGAGYMASPTVVVAGHPDVKIEAAIEFTQDFKTNGRLASLTIVE
jgi:hypothetical protein